MTDFTKISTFTIKRSIKDGVTTEELENALTKIKKELDELKNSPVEYEYVNGATVLSISYFVTTKCRYDNLLEMQTLIIEELAKKEENK